MKCYNWSEDLFVRFLALLEKGYGRLQSSKMLKIAYSTVWEHTRDEDSQKRIQLALRGPIELAEASLLQKVKDGNLGAIIFFLCNRDPENWRNTQYVAHQADEKTSKVLETLQRLAMVSAAASTPAPAQAETVIDAQVTVKADPPPANGNGHSNGNGHDWKTLEEK